MGKTDDLSAIISKLRHASLVEIDPLRECAHRRCKEPGVNESVGRRCRPEAAQQALAGKAWIFARHNGAWVGAAIVHKVGNDLCGAPAVLDIET